MFDRKKKLFFYPLGVGMLTALLTILLFFFVIIPLMATKNKPEVFSHTFKDILTEGYVARQYSEPIKTIGTDKVVLVATTAAVAGANPCEPISLFHLRVEQGFIQGVDRPSIFFPWESCPSQKIGTFKLTHWEQQGRSIQAKYTHVPTTIPSEIVVDGVLLIAFIFGLMSFVATKFELVKRYQVV